MAVIKAENVLKDYGLDGQVVHALRGISLEFEKGEFAAIAGPSGSGKSTFLHLAGCLDTLTGGNMSKQQLALLRRQNIGFIFQAYNLIPVLSVEENISFPLTLLGIAQKNIKERTAKILRDVGLEDMAKRRPKEMSGGQQQRVAIARALVKKPALIKAGYYAAPRFVFSGTLYSEGASAPVTFNAVDPIAESQVLRYTSYVENGRYIKSGAVELVVGTVLAKKLNILDSSGNNNVQISAMIDIKAVPEKIRLDKWEGELMPALKNEEKELLQSAYQWEDFMDAYLLKEEIELDSTKLANILETMIRTGFSGAVKHINQLIPAIVVGVINSPNPVTNFNIAYIPMDVLQGEQGMMLENRVTEILIRDKNANDAELPGKRESAAAITAVLDLPAELGVFTWIDYSKD